MKFVTFVKTFFEFSSFDQLVSEKKIENESFELILGLKDFSRFGELTLLDLEKIISLNQKKRYTLVFEWDILETENKFKETAKLILDNPFLKRGDFSAIRVQDTGAVRFIFEHFSWLKIQIVLENGNHNLRGLSSWANILGERLDRLVISNELTRQSLTQYAQVFPDKIEILVFGRIIVFYSPRKLLAPIYKKNQTNDLQSPKSSSIEVLGTSEEGPHSGFPIIENGHGSFMFNVKDLFLLEHVEELYKMKLAGARFDLRFDNYFDCLETCMSIFFAENKQDLYLEEEIRKFRISLRRPAIKGFYQTNKTDVLFSKLKNKKTARRDEYYLGEIVDSEKDLLLVLKLSNEISKENSKENLELNIETPEGKTKTLQLSWPLKNSLGESVWSGSKGEIVLIPYIRGVSVKSQVYFKDSLTRLDSLSKKLVVE